MTEVEITFFCGHIMARLFLDLNWPVSPICTCSSLDCFSGQVQDPTPQNSLLGEKNGKAVTGVRISTISHPVGVRLDPGLVAAWKAWWAGSKSNMVPDLTVKTGLSGLVRDVDGNLHLKN